MDIKAFIESLPMRPAALARTMGVSDGHIFDLKSGRRKLSIEMAAKLEAATGKTGLVDEVVKAKTGQ